MIKFSLNLKGPFDPELSLAFWLRHPMEKVDLLKDGTYQQALGAVQGISDFLPLDGPHSEKTS